MVKWLDKKDRARLQSEYHKGTIEARKAIIQEGFGSKVTYENFCEDWHERIEEILSEQGRETDAKSLESRTKEMKRATPSEEYFWDLICRGIFSDQTYEGALGQDVAGNPVALNYDSSTAHYRPPIWWMLGYCQQKFMPPATSAADSDDARFYGMPEEIPHSAKTRAYQGFQTARKVGVKIAAFLGIVYLLLRVIREIFPEQSR